MKAPLPALLLALPLFAGPRSKPAPAPLHWPTPPPGLFGHVAPPLPMLPSVSRVRIDAARDRVVVVEEVALPRGDWRTGGLDLYVAFGAPGTPIAVDAHLLAVPDGQSDPRIDDAGDAITVEPAVRHASSSQLLLGRPNMAGVVLHVKESELRAAYDRSEVAALRIRSLLSPPASDASGARDVVVRLGIDKALPLTLEKVEVASSDRSTIARAEATLCGPDADPSRLTVALLPRTEGASTDPPQTVAPPLVTRHPSDDLCVRWWAAP